MGATIDQLTDELRENFVNVPFDEENSEWEQSDNEDDVDSERNIFDDIMINGELITEALHYNLLFLPNI